MARCGARALSKSAIASKDIALTENRSDCKTLKREPQRKDILKGTENNDNFRLENDRDKS